MCDGSETGWITQVELLNQQKWFPDESAKNRIQIGMIRPIRVDHTKFLQVAFKIHSFIKCAQSHSGGGQRC